MVWLDSRPVIEQLTEPTPANVIHDAHGTFWDRVCDAHYDEKTTTRMLALLDEYTNALLEGIER